MILASLRRRVIRAFLASPSDLHEERLIARNVAQELNSNIAEQLEYQIELVGWEDTLSGYGRPQETINRDLESCELFIGMMWRRWGTPSDTDGRFTSGFEEEYALSVSRFESTGKPDITMFFRDVDSELARDPGEELKKVLAFKESITSSKTLLYETFSNADVFEKKLRNYLYRYVFKRWHEESGQLSGDASSRSKISGQTIAEASQPVDRNQQITGLLTYMLQDDQGYESQLTSYDVARIRLACDAAARPGNNERTLGSHDANIIYLQPSSIPLGQLESRWLVNCGFDNIKLQVIPFWRWLQDYERSDPTYIWMSSIKGPQHRRAGAIHTLRMLRRKPLPVPMHSELDYKSLWFSADAAHDVRREALQYLEENGSMSDESLIRSEFDRNDYQTRSYAANAIIAIYLRDMRMDALNIANQFEDSSINPDLVKRLFSNSSALTVSDLKVALAHKCSLIRLESVKALVKHHEIEGLALQSLLEDENIYVRLEVCKALQRTKVGVSLTQARDALVSTSKSAYDLQGNAALEAYKRDYFEGLSMSDLEVVVSSGSIFDTVAYFVLFERQMAARLDDLKHQLGGKFAERVEDYYVRNGGPADSSRVREYIKSEFKKDAAASIARCGTITELDLVRGLIDDPDVEPTTGLLNFFYKYGSYEDIRHILSLYSRRNASLYLIYSQNDDIQREAARTIVHVSRGRFTEALEMIDNGSLLAHCLEAASEAQVNSISLRMTLSLLQYDTMTVRRTAAQVLVKYLPKRSIRTIMSRYIEQSDETYYDVLFWLDFGISLPRRVTSGIKVIL